LSAIVDNVRERWQVQRAETESHWARVLVGVQRTRIVTRVILIYARYTCGYLATGFLISAPLQLVTHREWGDMFKSLILGVAFALPFLLLIPFTQLEWERMRLPEFKNFELALTRWASYCAGAFFALSGLLQITAPETTLGWLCDVRVAWVELVLMFFAWVGVKFHTVLFREFYTLKPDDDDLVLVGLAQRAAKQVVVVSEKQVPPATVTPPAGGGGPAPPA